MTRSKPASIALTIVATITLAACGSSATPAPSVAGGPAGASNASPVAASRVPGSSVAASSRAQTGASVFGPAADNLDKLASYKFSVLIETTSNGKTSITTMAGTVINSPTKSYALDMSGTTPTSVIMIGSDAWMKVGTGYQQVTAAMAESFIASMSAFRPEKLFALAFGVNGDKFSRVADEDRNGVPSTHYKGDQSLNSLYSGLFGVTASFSSDVWIARTGGFVVASEIRTTGASATASGSYSSTVNITDVNSGANKVERPG